MPASSWYRWAGLGILWLFLLGSLVLAQEGGGARDGFLDQVEVNGVRVGLQLTRQKSDRPAGLFREGDDLDVTFVISDTAGQAPLKSLYPAAWMDLRSGRRETAVPCAAKARNFLSGSLFSKAEIDLNVFYVLVLNQDNSISVVDPLFGFGGSRLLAMVQLEAPGYDWAMNQARSRLYVSMPEANRLAVIDTAGWTVLANVATPPKPGRLAMQADGRFLWLAHAQGVSAFDCRSGQLVATVPLASAPADLAADGRNRFLFASLPEQDSLAVIHVGRAQLTRTLATDSGPAALAYSALAETVLLACTKGGTLLSIDARDPRILARMPAEPGLGALAFAPGERFAFALNPETNMLTIADAARNRIVQRGPVAERPTHLGFSADLAYVLHGGTDLGYMVPLSQIGTEGEAIPLIDFPAARLPLAAGQASMSVLARAPVEQAVMFPNPADGTVFYYREGMAAPMGQFKNYGHTPKMVAVLDRSLQEWDRPGHYRTTVHLEKPGSYDLIFFLESPRIVHCFTVEVQPDPQRQALREKGRFHIAHGTGETQVSAKSKVTRDFRLTGPDGKPLDGLRDVKALFMAPGGTWFRKVPAQPRGDGVYRAAFVPPRPGVYYLYVSSTSAGIPAGNRHYAILNAH